MRPMIKMVRATTPPTTPPAMAPALVDVSAEPDVCSSVHVKFSLRNGSEVAGLLVRNAAERRPSGQPSEHGLLAQQPQNGGLVPLQV